MCGNYLNPKLVVGDRVVLYHMEGAYTDLHSGCEGTVQTSPKGSRWYLVKWDNGSLVPLFDRTDVFRKITID